MAPLAQMAAMPPLVHISLATVAQEASAVMILQRGSQAAAAAVLQARLHRLMVVFLCSVTRPRPRTLKEGAVTVDCNLQLPPRRTAASPWTAAAAAALMEAALHPVLIMAQKAAAA